MGILRQRRVTERVGLARSTLYKGVAEGWFPAPIQLTGGAVGWLEEEVEEWIRTRPRAEVKRPEPETVVLGIDQ